MNNPYRFIVNFLVLVLFCSTVLSQAACARWTGVESWQDLKMSPDIFLHIFVGNAIGTLVQTKFPNEDRRSQFIKALTIALGVGLVKEIYDVSVQYKRNQALYLPDSIKDMANNFLGVFISFNFDFGAPKEKGDKTLSRTYEEPAVSLNSTPESISLPTNSLYRHDMFSLTF